MSMWRLLLKSLLAEPIGLAASIVTAASAFLLVLLFQAVYTGESEQVVSYLRHADADVWVMQQGVSNMHMATSFLPDSRMARIEELPGVAAVDGILYLNSVIEAGGHKWFAYVVGIEPDASLAGPWSMARGRPLPERGEAVVPEAFALMAGAGLGDSVRVTDREFRIVGLSAGTFSMANSIVFTTRTELEDIMEALDIVSFILVKGEQGVDASELVRIIEADIPNVSAYTRDEFVENDRRMALQMGVETIALMTAIGGVLAALIVAFTVYARVIRQRRELAVAKALGLGNGPLYLGVALQAVLITSASLVLATATAFVLGPVIDELLPQVSLAFGPRIVVIPALAGIVVAIAASLVPARQVARVDPASVFRA